ncbi:aminoglycoside phosphotransferase family protein [Candidatus Micrarchaeota archaeon]|nr:aminoglycoside phosphotransferase family protein [Candidatus Micrarchaeota archaeon]
MQVNKPPSEKLIRLLEAESEKLPFFDGHANAEFLRKGLANVAYKVNFENKDYLVKFAVGPASKPTVYIQASYEKALAEKILKLGVSPKFFSFGAVHMRGRKFPYNIQEYISGKDLDYSKDLRKLAKVLSRLHLQTLNSPKVCDYRVLDPSNYLKKKASDYLNGKLSKDTGGIGKRLQKTTKKALEKLSRGAIDSKILCLIHNDLTPENILVSKNRAYLIDWGWAMYSTPAFDLCNALSPFTTSWNSKIIATDRQVEGFLEAYFSNWKRPDGEKIMLDVEKYWLAYNSMLANWIHIDFLPNYKVLGKMHFKESSFMKNALEAVERIDLLLQKRK